MSVKIIVDSASDIEAKEAEKMGVILVPLQIIFGEETFDSGIDLSNDEFFKKLQECSDHPKTSQVNLYAFEQVFQKIVDDGDEAVAVLISSKISGTCQNGMKAAEKFKDKIFVVDSLNLSLGEKLLCKMAVQLAKKGKSAKEIADILNEAKGKIRLHAMLDTLKYLKKGGRISALIAFAGELLSIKPIISVIDGEIKLIGKTIGQKLAFRSLNQFIKETNIDDTKPYGFLYSGSDKNLKKFLENNEVVKSKFKETPCYNVCGVIGTHTGPNGVGFVFFEK